MTRLALAFCYALTEGQSGIIGNDEIDLFTNLLFTKQNCQRHFQIPLQIKTEKGLWLTAACRPNDFRILLPVIVE